MTRNIVISKVQKMLNNNPQIDEVFKPIIEEFFVRLTEQFNFSENELDGKLNKYNELKSMNFYKGEERKKGFLIQQVIKNTGRFMYSWNYNDITKKIYIKDKRINFDVDYLKSILLGNKKVIEEFIDLTFHEQGHFIQLHNEDMSYNNGLEATSFKQGIDYISWKDQGKIINEFAEIINAKRLSKGNLNEKKYSGYEDIQSIARVIFSSLGISDKQLGKLQMEGIGRQNYEKFIEQKVGKDYIEPLIAMEDALDSIDAIRTEMLSSNLFTNIELEKNMAIQFETINTISNEMIKRRIEILGENINIGEYAKIIIDKKIRDENLSKALKIFKLKLPIGFKINIEPDICENIKQYTDKNKLQYEIEKLQKEHNEENSESIEYDNTELINKMIELAQNYDISKFSLKDRIELTICKNISKFRNIFIKSNVKMLPEKTFISMQEQRKNFTTRINGNYVIEQNNIKLNKSDYIQKRNREEKDENIR